MLYDDGILLYQFAVDSNVIHAYDINGTDLGTVTVGLTSLTFGSENLTVNMNNQVLSVGRDDDFTEEVRLADYWYSVVLQDVVTSDYYNIYKELDGDIYVSNGSLDTYKIQLNSSNNLVAIQDSNEYAITVTDTNISFDDNNLKMLTPYIYNASTREIIGNRVEVISSSQLRFTVPQLTSGQGYKDVTIMNPDTKEATLSNGFYYYTNPSSNPVISLVDPNFGSISGGSQVTLYGFDFDETSRVFVDGTEISSGDVNINLDYTEIDIILPAYTKDLTELNTTQIWVPIVVLNQDGGTANKEKGFLYVIPSSAPSISSITTNTGSTTGGAVVAIEGYDFRYFEPYTNEVGGPGYDVGDSYVNLNGSLNVLEEWDDLENDYTSTDIDTAASVDLREPKTFDGGATYSFYSEYYDSPILPDIYFGTEKS